MCHTNCVHTFSNVYHKGLKKKRALPALWFCSPFLQNCVLFLVREMTSSQLFLSVQGPWPQVHDMKTFFKMPC